MLAVNLVRSHKKYFQQKCWKMQSCLLSTDAATATPTSATKTFKSGWANAKPYEEIPSVKGLKGMVSFLPGGKYYNMPPPDLFRCLRRDLGNIVKFDGYFGRKNIVITHNVEDFVTVFRNEGIWPERPSMQSSLYHRSVYRADFFKGVEGLITTQGEKWANFRSVVSPVLMQPKNARLYLYEMSQINKEFIERIRQIRNPKTLEVPHNFEEEINRLTLESIVGITIDKRLGLMKKNHDDPLAKELFQALKGFFNYAIKVENTFPIWKFYKTKAFKNLMNSLDTIMFTTNTYTNEALQRIEDNEKLGVPEKPEQEKSILEKLIKINKKIAAVMSMDMLMAGVDTTSSTFAGLLLCLAKNPRKQVKLREEVTKILPHKDSEFTEETMKNMPYLRACIKESLRMYPIVASNSRSPINDVVLSGYRVPKGAHVEMVFATLIDNDAYFPRAKEYIPERWLRVEDAGGRPSAAQCPNMFKQSNPFVFLPFGFGPRTCVGRRIVEMELEVATARIIRNFHIEYNYSTENAFKSVLINVPNIPLMFKFSDVKD